MSQHYCTVHNTDCDFTSGIHMAAADTATKYSMPNSVKTTHKWTDPDTGEVYPSVSAIKGVIDKPAINGWRVKRTAERALESYESGELRERLTVEGKIKTRKWLQRASYDHLDTAALKGSFLHEMADLHAKGLPLPTDMTEESRKRVEWFFRFLDAYDLRYLMTEVSMVNRVYRVCGTADAIVEYEGENQILDYKSSASGVFGENALQLAAYAHMEYWVRESDFGEQTLEPLPDLSWETGMIVRITADGYYVHHAELNNKVDLWSAFAAARVIYPYYLAAQEYGAPSLFREGGQESITDQERYARNLATAKTHEALNFAYLEARQAGAWNEQLLAIAQQRRAELNEAA